MNKNKLSVIIRSKNEENWIGHCIQSILDHLYKPEIIVVDNNSDDETLSIVQSFKEDPMLKNNNNKYTNIKIYSTNKYSPGKSINIGVKKSSNQNILVISAHCILKKINLDKHIKDLKKYKCIFGNQIPVWKGKKISKRYIWSHFVNKEVVNMYSQMENRHFMHNALAFYNRNFLLKNKFNENLTSKEDRYWVDMIIKKKFKYLYDPAFEVEHQYTPNGNTWKGIG